MRKAASAIPHVCLGIPPVSGHTQRILSGIARYVAEHSPWTFEFSPWNHYRTPPELKEADGVIALVADEGVARVVADSGLPTVNVGSTSTFGLEFPTVQCDHDQVGRLAAQEFAERGFEHVGFVGELDRNFVRPRLEAFADYSQARGVTSRTYRLPEHHLDRADLAVPMTNWLTRLPKPIGVMAQNDLKARDVLQACRMAGLRVPDDVAVIGVDDDEVLCHLTPPPLSSVRLDSERMGYEAARMLDGLMRGDPQTPRLVTLPPLCVVTRQSSDVFAIDDPDVVTALRFMRDHMSEEIDIRDVLQHVPVSRRWLEMQFKRFLGRSPAEELRRLRIERAKMLLRESAMSVLEVAVHSGFSGQATFAVSFKREVGCSPSAYRHDARA